MELPKKVYEFYLDSKGLLGEDKLFHFASRMAAWTGDPKAFEILKVSHDYIVRPEVSLNEVMAELIDKPQTGRRNAHELRQPFFEKYPKLYGIHLALFRLRHLEAVYGINARESLFSAVPKAELIDLENALLDDTEAMKVLSTFAINYLYLLERTVFKNENSLPIDQFYNLGSLYDTDNIDDLQLMIYLYTHCIIGESNFYTRNISDEKLPIYRKMLTRLEELMEINFEKINLDNKLEFLVCARICHFETNLNLRIFEECEKSISPNGTYIIDVHNKNGQDSRDDFVRSEHRNVLFIMSSTAYNPHSTLIR